ncbi:CueP family metal-binding protein [Parenemella sanctibonifatiensis]|uniref:CueP family metal-binding protein n=1 Tax=Parenemella sanctibonifatiensis TaxID=2016505 RepID=UPI0015C66FA1|nr:CueP family metal-binding protein [Parenemella sanctibonifatiensis]
MKRVAIAAATLSLVLAGCAPAADAEPSPSTDSQAEFLNTYDLDDMDAVEIIDHLDRLETAERPADLIASVYPDELVLTDNRQEVVLDLPQNLSYLSIAPYVEQTHDCFYHSLTTCQGELSNATVDVEITDSTTGDVVVDEQATTFDNGFVGFWVPSDIDGTIEISYDGRTGTSDFTTTDEGATCITDLQLA